MSDSRHAVARTVWSQLEAIHAVVYFHEGVVEHMATVGLSGFWRSYFAGRLAPLGAVGPAAAESIVAGFSPDMVERYVPAVWSVVSPADARATWSSGAAHALHDLGVAELLPGGAAIGVVRDVVRAWPTSGRPLGAAWRRVALESQTADPVLEWWLLATAWRELRGDGHVAALALGGLDGALAHAVRLAGDGADADWQQRARGYDDLTWAAARDAAADPERGPALARAYRQAERATDDAASAWWPDGVEVRLGAVTDVLRPAALQAAAALPYPNPIGVTRPSPR